MSWNLKHRSAPALRFWGTLAFRLTACYVLAALALVVVASTSLYFGLVTELKKSTDLFLADKIHVVRTMLRDRPDDWDGLRELISADARLLVADRYSGSFAAGGYLGVYSRMQVAWRLALGDVDGEPSIILLNQRNGEWEIEGIVRLDIGADGRVEQISDYQHCPWILTAGSIVVQASID